MSVRIALIDWNLGVRSARRLILDATPNIDVVFESSGAPDELKQLSDLLVDVIVIEHQLDQRSGVEAFLEMRKSYEQLQDVPSSLLTTPFSFDEVRLSALAAGMHDVVSIESGPSGFIEAITLANQALPSLDLSSLAKLIASNPVVSRSDFGFTQAVSALPARKKALVEKLAKDWSRISTGSKPALSLDQFDALALPLGCLSASELVIKLLQNGFLDAN